MIAIESVLLASLGALLEVLVSEPASGWCRWVETIDVASSLSLTIPLIGFALGVIVGRLPAIKIRRLDVMTVLR